MLSNRRDHELFVTPMTQIPELLYQSHSQNQRRNSQQSSGYSSLENCVVSSEPFLMHYMLGKVIGKGNFSVVKKAEHLPTNMQVAIKMVDKSKLSPHDLGRVSREVNILKHLRHPHITKMYQVVETTTHLYMVMEYVQCGELFDYVQKNGKFSEPVARQKFIQLIDAVDYCHKQGIVHRDLKMENILLDSDLNVKLADFGFGTYNNSDNFLKTFCGSPPYAAPEIFQGVPYKGVKSDIWSLGVILFCMVVGGMPFEQECLPSLRMQVLSGKFRVPYWVSLPCDNLMRSMLRVQPERRTTITQIKSHSWMTYEENGQHNLSTFTGFLSSSNNSSTTPSSGSMPFSWQPEALEIMARYGHSRQHIAELLHRKVYDHVMAHYLLLCDYLTTSSASNSNYSIATANSMSNSHVSTPYSLPSSPALCVVTTNTTPHSPHVILTTDSGIQSHIIQSPHHRLVTENISDQLNHLHLCHHQSPISTMVPHMNTIQHSSAGRQTSLSVSQTKENGPMTMMTTSPITMYVPSMRLRDPYSNQRQPHSNMTSYTAAPSFNAHLQPQPVPQNHISAMNTAGEKVPISTCNALHHMINPPNATFNGCSMTPYSQRRMSLAYTSEPPLSVSSHATERPTMFLTVPQNCDVSYPTGGGGPVTIGRCVSPLTRDGPISYHRPQQSQLTPGHEFACYSNDNPPQACSNLSQQPRPPVLNFQAVSVRRASDVPGLSPSHRASGYGVLRLVPACNSNETQPQPHQQQQSYRSQLQRVEGVWELARNVVDGSGQRIYPNAIPEHKIVDNRHGIIISPSASVSVNQSVNSPLVASSVLTCSHYDESTSS